MTDEEAGMVLAFAATLDMRLSPPTVEDGIARAKAWAATLATDMPVRFAVNAVRKHYAATTETIMPAHLNTVWRAQSELDRGRRAVEAARAGQGVPMPPEVRARIQRILGKTPDA